MGKIETALKAEIARLARKETRAAVAPLAAEVRRLKKRVAQLTKTSAEASRTSKTTARLVKAQPIQLSVSKTESQSSRLSPTLIKKLRKRLGISQAELAKLVGVSPVAVQFWESGRTKPTQENRSAIVALRKHGKRDIQALLEAKEHPPRQPSREKAKKTVRRKQSKRK